MTKDSPAPALIRLDLCAQGNVGFSMEPVRSLHGALHQVLMGWDPALAGRVHESRVMPLTLSPLVVAASGRPLRTGLRAGGRVWARIGVLEAETLTALFGALAMLWRTGRPLPLGGTPFAVEAVTAVGPPGMLRPATSYTDLAAAEPVTDLVLRFTTPTTFRQEGDHFLHPAPRLVFGSYLRRWRAFSPVPLAEVSLSAFEERIVVVERELTTSAVDLGVARHPGFTGWAQYHVTGDDSFRRGVATLAAYASYCGTGARTPYGMGQTEVQRLGAGGSRFGPEVRGRASGEG